MGSSEKSSHSIPREPPPMQRWQQGMCCLVFHNCVRDNQQSWTTWGRPCALYKPHWRCDLLLSVMWCHQKKGPEVVHLSLQVVLEPKLEMLQSPGQAAQRVGNAGAPLCLWLGHPTQCGFCQSSLPCPYPDNGISSGCFQEDCIDSLHVSFSQRSWLQKESRARQLLFCFSFCHALRHHEDKEVVHILNYLDALETPCGWVQSNEMQTKRLWCGKPSLQNSAAHQPGVRGVSPACIQ